MKKSILLILTGFGAFNIFAATDIDRVFEQQQVIRDFIRNVEDGLRKALRKEGNQEYVEQLRDSSDLGKDLEELRGEITRSWKDLNESLDDLTKLKLDREQKTKFIDLMVLAAIALDNLETTFNRHHLGIIHK